MFADFGVILLGEQVIDDHVIGALEWTSGEILKWTAEVIKVVGRFRIEVDAVDNFEISGGNDVHDDGRDGNNMRNGTQLVGDLDGDGRAGNSGKKLEPGGETMTSKPIPFFDGRRYR